MDFLKSAVVSAISKGPAFPFTFGDRVDVEQSIWELYNGTRREDGRKCSIFTFDIVAKKSLLPLARNAMRKLRTLRHPGVIKVIDTLETDTMIYIATERLVPLSWHTRRKSLHEETLLWGLFYISKALSFIHNEATSVHGSVRTASIFTTESGEWKLGGFEVLSSMKEDDPVIYTYGSLLPKSGQHAPPELVQSGWQTIKNLPVHAVDSYNLGTFVYEIFNGVSSASGQVGQTTNIPQKLQQSYKRLLNSNPRVRMSVEAFVTHGQRAGGFFDCELVHLTEGLENMGLKSDEEREEYLEELSKAYEEFPEDFLKMKVLPELLKATEYAGGGPQVLSLAIKIGANLPDDDFEALLSQNLIRLYTSPDRATRVCLLNNLSLYVDRFSQKIVNDKIFPQIVTGFTDVTPVVREQTVKSILSIAPKLSDRTLNGELLRYLAKTANDEQPGIRTNTTICLGKIARNLSANTRAKVLTAAFARALRDPFVHARNASLMALAATMDLFSDEDCALKILPGVCPMLVDKEKIVRDQANKTLETYLQRVRQYSQSLPETALPTSSSTQPTVSAPRSGASQDTWAGWAISSFTNKISGVRGEMQTGTNGAAAGAVLDNVHRPTLPTRPETARNASPSTSTATFGGQKTPLSLGSLPPSTAQSVSSLSAMATPSFEDNTSSNINNNPLDDSLPNEWANEPDLLADPLQQSTTTTTTNPLEPSTTSTPLVDDNAEPDFAGWLAAQGKAKTKSKNPLPKGLAKAKRPVAGGRAATTGSAAVSSSGPGTTAKKKPIVGGTRSKAVGAAMMTTAKEEMDNGKEEKVDKGGEDDGWGDDWA